MTNKRISGFASIVGVVFIGSILCVGLSASSVIGITKEEPIQQQDEPQEEIVDPYDEKLYEWIDELIQKESSNRHDIKILDVNNRYSYGCLQYQTETFLYFAKHPEFGVFTISTPDSQVLWFLYDCPIQKEITFRSIQHNYENWEHWHTSVIDRGLGLPPVSKVADNKIEQ